MKFSKLQLTAVLLIIFSLSIVSDLWAQRNVSYADLAMRSQQQPVFFDFIQLPGEEDNTVAFSSIFSFSYNYLPFKKLNNASSTDEFYSHMSLNMEVFHAQGDRFKPRREENISVEGLESADRAFWSDTAYANTYEQSRSKDVTLNGHITIDLQPGTYNYVLQMKRGSATDDRISRTQSVRIESYRDKQTGGLILGEKIVQEAKGDQLKLINMGKNVRYAENFYAMVYLPQYDNSANYRLQITKLSVADEDTSKQQEVFATNLSQSDIKTGLRPKITSSDKAAYVNLHPDKNGFTYALMEIPNKNFENALYQLTVNKEGEKRPVARGVYRSLWVDMPASLLSLDVAIEMLDYIADKKTMDRLSSGTRAEREEKFREYWEKRDPTPKTEFNELMAEYYRRIDYAFKNFSSANTMGHQSDQGEVYIKFGPPNNVDRQFPTSGATTEVWTYPNRKFVFRATTGFGDFKLVSQESR